MDLVLRILDVVYCTHPAIRSLDPKREEMCSCCDGHLWECGCWSCWSILMLLMLKKGRNSSFLPFFYAKRWSRKQKTSVNWGSWLGMGQRSGILLWNLARKLPWAHPNKKPRVIWSWHVLMLAGCSSPHGTWHPRRTIGPRSYQKSKNHLPFTYHTGHICIYIYNCIYIYITIYI